MKAIGEYIDNYRIIAVQADTPTSTLYIVEHTYENSGTLALKSWKMYDATSAYYSTFSEQVLGLMKLKLPHCLPILDYGIDEDDRPYLILPEEALSLQTLQQRLKHDDIEPVTEDTSRKILGQVGTVLVIAHQEAIVHGALSPEAILLTPENEVLVSFAPLITSTVGLRSSFDPLYQPPENTMTRLSDQFALGGLAGELLIDYRTGPTIDAPTEHAISQAQSPDPGQRFRSVRHFLQHLGIQIALNEDQSEYELLSFISHQTTQPPYAQSAPPSPPNQKQLVYWVAAIAAILLLIGGFIWNVNYGHQQTLFEQATATSVSQTAIVAQKTISSANQATTIAEHATATVAAKTYPFSANVAFHDDLTKLNASWDGTGCGFGGEGYFLKADKNYFVGCPRLGTETETNYTFQIIFKNFQGSPAGSIGLLFDAKTQLGANSGSMFLIDKDGNYGIYNIALIGGTPSQSGKISFPLKFPLRIGMVARSNGCTFYVNGTQVEDIGWSCKGSLGAAALGLREATMTYFVEAELWNL
ncbi:hypothetical protein [Ktedonospora formicarum]|uniref:Protein kinase domain-containing protein n=1 Tax=Ktedonospora formicarum TaxID=2778364 RepID=A0A8J3HTL4_9CHLR|nr:hypothetical protein [Ktedonospora formicarum]GHO43041.1 hypothetical protein KSX_12040 [Ktedonospora formicarum]